MSLFFWQAVIGIEMWKLELRCRFERARHRARTPVTDQNVQRFFTHKSVGEWDKLNKSSVWSSKKERKRTQSSAKLAMTPGEPRRPGMINDIMVILFFFVEGERCFSCSDQDTSAFLLVQQSEETEFVFASLHKSFCLPWHERNEGP